MATNPTREEFYRDVDKARHRKGFSCIIFAGILGLIGLGLIAYLFLLK